MKKRRMLFIVIGMLTLFCYIQGAKYNAFLREKSSDVYLISQKEQSDLSAEHAAKIQALNKEKEEPSVFAIWGEMENVTITNSDLKKETIGKAILVSGRTNLLFPGYKALDSESKTTCLISSGMAIKLFGRSDVSGLTLNFQGQHFEVVDVIESEEFYFVCETSAIESEGDKRADTTTDIVGMTELVSLNRVTIQVNQEDSITDTWKRNKEFFGEFDLLSIVILKSIMNLIILIVPMILCVFLLSMIKRHFHEAKGNFKERSLWFGIGTVVAVCIMLAIINNFEFPQDMIPSKWSDFKFWAKFWEENKKTILLLISSSKTIIELEVLFIFWKAFIYQLLAIVGTISCRIIMSCKIPSLSVRD